MIGDFWISKSAIESTDNYNEDSIILYMAPEIFIDKKYTTSSDTHSFRMTICEFMTDRRPFWNKILVIELIIKICDGKMNYDTNAP